MDLILRLDGRIHLFAVGARAAAIVHSKFDSCEEACLQPPDIIQKHSRKNPEIIQA
jgi:hypothetical protein